MASVKKEEIPVIADFMSKFWNFIKSHYVPEQAESYWNELMKDAKELGNKYDDVLCHEFILCYLDYLEWKQTDGWDKYISPTVKRQKNRSDIIAKN